MTDIKNLKKGDMVILRAFTGMAIGKKEVIAADAKTVTVETNSGNIKFSKKTGLQIEPAPKAERFANYITEDDGSYEKELKERAAKKAAKTKDKPKAEKKAKKSEPEDIEDDESDEEEKPAKKSKAAKPTKKSKPAPEPEEDDEDEDEDEDDDDFEEVE